MMALLMEAEIIEVQNLPKLKCDMEKRGKRRPRGPNRLTSGDVQAVKEKEEAAKLREEIAILMSIEQSRAKIE